MTQENMTQETKTQGKRFKRTERNSRMERRQVWTQHKMYDAIMSIQFIKSEDGLKEDQFQIEFKVEGTRCLFWYAATERAAKTYLEPVAVACYNGFTTVFAEQDGLPVSPDTLDLYNTRVQANEVLDMLHDAADQELEVNVKVVTDGNGKNKRILYLYNNGEHFQHNLKEIQDSVERAKKRAQTGNNNNNSKPKTAADVAASNLDAPPPF